MLGGLVSSFAVIAILFYAAMTVQSANNPHPDFTPWKWNTKFKHWEERYPANKNLPRDVIHQPPKGAEVSSEDEAEHQSWNSGPISMESLQAAMPVMEAPSEEDMRRWYGTNESPSYYDDTYDDEIENTYRENYPAYGQESSAQNNYNSAYEWYYALSPDERPSGIEYILLNEHGMNADTARYYMIKACAKSNMMEDPLDVILDRVFRRMTQRKAMRRRQAERQRC